MKDELLRATNLEEKDEVEQVTVKTGKRWRKVSVLATVMCLVFAVSASAESPTGMANVLAQSSNVSSLVNTAFGLITDNPLLATFCLMGLVAGAIRLFRRGRRATGG